jgi:hypothetical protein
MLPTELTLFAIMLFLALVALLEWKRRRLVVRQRMNRGLRDFVANTPPAPETEDADSAGDSLMVVQ